MTLASSSPTNMLDVSCITNPTHLKQLPVQLPMPLHAASKVYCYFEHIGTAALNGVEKPRLRCRLCFEFSLPVQSLYRHSGSTDLFNDHMKRRHPQQWVLVTAANPTIKSKASNRKLDQWTIESIDSTIDRRSLFLDTCTEWIWDHTCQ